MELLPFNQTTRNLEDSNADIRSKLDSLAMELQDRICTRPEKVAHVQKIMRDSTQLKSKLLNIYDGSWAVTVRKLIQYLLYNITFYRSVLEKIKPICVSLSSRWRASQQFLPKPCLAKLSSLSQKGQSEGSDEVQGIVALSSNDEGENSSNQREASHMTALMLDERIAPFKMADVHFFSMAPGILVQLSKVDPESWVEIQQV
ncbi:hypothetical protein BDD12DRAFT_805609 [Trichophaea hybrida]|nr:hypothetical protein BDD12DRAFT_805609 [Trichophaea hybrida]